MAKMFLACFSLFVFLGSVLAATDFLSPLTPHGCASDEFGSTACNAGDYSQCCPYGSLCCAGGCCAAGSLCVNAGTSKEGCCSIFSANLCGADLTSVSNPVFCIDGIEGGSYWCPAGSECAQDGTCNGASGADKPPLAKTAKVATADATSTQKSSKTSSHTLAQTTGIPVASRADPPEATATSSAGAIVVGSGGSSAAATNPKVAFVYAAGFSSMAGIILAVMLL